MAWTSKEFADCFSFNVWWYSLLHEKNTVKSRAFHDLVKGLKPDNRFVALKAFYNAIRKYFSFVYRWWCFLTLEINADPKKIIVSPNGDFLIPLYNAGYVWILLPQKATWERDLEKVKSSNVLPLESFLVVKDYFIIAYQYFAVLWQFFCSLAYMKRAWFNVFGDWVFGRENCYKYFKREVWESFAGGVLIEGLFYHRAFKNMRGKFTNLEKVCYNYEGQAWEKALCLAMPDVKKVGVLCNVTAENLTSFQYHDNEVKLMPKPDHLGVIGKTSYYRLKNVCEDVFVLGSMRQSYLKEWKEKYGSNTYDGLKNVLVVCGVNDRLNEELVAYAADKYFDNSSMYVRQHPSKCTYKQPSLEKQLLKASIVVTFESSVGVEALAFGNVIKVDCPELPSFVSMCPLEEEGKRLEDYFAFQPIDRMVRWINDL